MKNTRAKITAITLSAAALVGLLSHEGYSDGRGKRFFYIPPAFKACVQSLVRYFCFFRPLAKRKRLTIECNNYGAFSVSNLCFTVRPSTVFWAISFCSIYPVNRMFRSWCNAHIGKKIFKYFPSFTNKNTLLKVQKAIFVCVNWTATTAHKCPSIVFFGRPSVIWVSTLPMFFVRKTSFFFLKTATRFCMSVYKFARSNFRSITTTANTKPYSGRSIDYTVLSCKPSVRTVS